MKPFPKEKLARMYAIYTIRDGGGTQSFDYKSLNLIVQNGQLCFYHKESNLIMPIARKNTIEALFEKEKNNYEKN